MYSHVRSLWHLELIYYIINVLTLSNLTDFVRVPHAGRVIELTDTPWGDFQSDANAALDGSDGAVIVASASDGVQAGSISSFKYCKNNGIKSIMALSKMDRPFVDIPTLLRDFELALGMKPIPIQIPLGTNFDGVSLILHSFVNDDGSSSSLFLLIDLLAHQHRFNLFLLLIRKAMLSATKLKELIKLG